MVSILTNTDERNPFATADEFREKLEMLERRIMQLETVNGLLTSCMDTQMRFYNKQK